MAPLPEPGQGEFPGAHGVSRLSALYAQLGDDLARELMALVGRGPGLTARDRNRGRVAARRLLASTELKADAIFTEAVRAALNGGGQAVARALEEAGPVRRPVMNPEARRILRANLDRELVRLEGAYTAKGTGYLRGAHASIGRQFDDILRRISVRQVATGVEAGATMDTVALGIEQSIAKAPASDVIKDISGRRFVVDRAGRKLSPQLYAETVARTTTREAMTEGLIAKAKADGWDLVQVSQHQGGAIDPICVPFEGQVFSISGLTPGYPVLAERPPFHPNCRHVLTPAPTL